MSNLCLAYLSPSFLDMDMLKQLLAIMFLHVGLKDDRGIVKFSRKKDLPVQQCLELLLEIIPEDIRETKVAQKLFVK